MLELKGSFCSSPFPYIHILWASPVVARCLWFGDLKCFALSETMHTCPQWSEKMHNKLVAKLVFYTYSWSLGSRDAISTRVSLKRKIKASDCGAVISICSDGDWSDLCFLSLTAFSQFSSISWLKYTYCSASWQHFILDTMFFLFSFMLFCLHSCTIINAW